MHNMILDIHTPAFIYDEKTIEKNCRLVREVSDKAGVKFLFALKALAFSGVTEIISQYVDGFAASSPFEAMLAKEIRPPGGTVHLTAPGIEKQDIEVVSRCCDHIAFNSLSQWDRFKTSGKANFSAALRINPQLSYVGDNRYNPTRKYSKLGIPLEYVVDLLNSTPQRFLGIDGIHFHSNCESSSFQDLFDTIRHLDDSLGELLTQITWINLGGGYYFDRDSDLEPFYEAVKFIRAKYNFDIFIEPGASIVRESGFIASSVTDIISNEGKQIAILDTSVNHMPEVFEYQFEPDVIGHMDGAEYEYILAGCTCLAGDVFGEYSFDEPLEVGSRVIFSNAGAYTLVKAHMFNGVNLPSIYAYTQDGKLELKKEFAYEDFLSRCGGNKYVSP